MNILITLLIALVVIVAIFWIVDQVGLPGNIHWLVKAILALIAIVYLLQFIGVVLV